MLLLLLSSLFCCVNIGNGCDCCVDCDCGNGKGRDTKAVIAPKSSA